jgi:hypothetical protein
VAWRSATPPVPTNPIRRTDWLVSDIEGMFVGTEFCLVGNGASNST